MEINEKEYLSKTLKILSKKIDENKNEISKYTQKLDDGKKEIAENFSDLTRGDDLSQSYDTMGLKQMLLDEALKQQKKLNLQKNNPYFARINFKPNNKRKELDVYIGIGNVIEGQKLYVADWRAPISSIYYDYNIGPAKFYIDKDEFKGEITLKRQYKIQDSTLISYFDTNLTINDDILKQILSQNVSTKMRQIVSTLQQEQNQIIRTDIDENLLIQGVAGSGKTSIALHRAAFLLYRHKDTIKSNDIIIISPNKIFSSYISEVLPQLGEDNLCETTFDQIVRAELKRSIQSREDFLDDIVEKHSQKTLNEVSYKSSFEYLDALLRFLKGPFLETFTPRDLVYRVSDNDDDPNKDVIFSAEQTKDLFFKKFKGLDLYERINKIAWQYAMYFTEARHYNKEQNRGLVKRFKNILFKFLPISDIDKIFQIFMAREGLTVNRSSKISYMDKGTYLTIKHFLHGFDHDFNAKYLIVDEMQDFTPVDIYIFKKLWNCPKIIVGDVNQCLEKNLSEDYLSLTADFLGCKLMEIKKTYRSTKEIAEFANSLTSCANTEFVNRNGQKPTLVQCENQIDEIVKIINNECASYDHIAIVCKCHNEARKIFKELKKRIDCTLMEKPEDYNNRILVCSCATAKGIEFDAVIMPNADEENYKNTIDKNIIYVTSTRALHKLFFTCEKNPSHILKNNFLQKA